MDEIAAVAAAVASDEPDQGAGGACTTPELERDRHGHERGERVREQAGGRRAQAERDQRDTGDDRRRERQEKHLAERAQRRPAPGDERPDPHQQEERQTEAVQEEVVVRLRDRPRLAAHSLRQQWVHDAPEDRQAERDEQQVVVEKRRLARDERLELRPRAQQRQAHVDEDHGEGRHEDDEAQEPAAERALGERVDRVDHPGAGEERAEDREAECERDEDHVPELQHAALLLDHHRVQERGRGEPRHERSVLHRVPRVVPAPADLDVGPVSAEELPDAEERPGGERPAPCRDDPPLVGAARKQRAHRERERDRQPDVAQVEQRRVREHVGVLQARHHAGAVRRCGRRLERARDEAEHEGEEHGDACEHGHDPGDQVARLPVQPDGERRVPGQDHEPEQERALLSAPERGERVAERQ